MGAKHVYAVMDATDDDAVRKRTKALGLGRAVALYEGTDDEPNASSGPHAWRLDEGLWSWLESTYRGKPWGIVALSGAPYDTVIEHLQGLCVVLSPEGKELYFRYYDPRILSVFLPTCTMPELGQLFGPVEAYLVPSAKGDDYERWTMNETTPAASAGVREPTPSARRSRLSPGPPR
ncbi:MAG: DUF4123 domain-containing protein [Myxococcales bacterium]|nr:DUF4123 domain-containing protein [Myxococcales bacterium]